MGKGVDGGWTKTGGIDHGFGRWEMAFSPDNHHFVTWFQDTGGHCEKCPEYARKDFFVILFALADNHQWAEKTRIIKYARRPVDCFPLKAGFSPDGKHLLVCAESEFDIWTLGDNGHWSPTLEKVPYVCGDTLEGNEGAGICYTSDPGIFMMLGRNNGSVWGLQDDGSWKCRHIFFLDWDTLPQISPDGKAIVCQRSFDKIGLWVEQPNGEWGWRRFDFEGQNPRFNQDGSLLAIKESTEGVLILMGPGSDGRWNEKKRLRFRGKLDSFDFSRNGRSIQVQYIDGGQRVLMILDIVTSNGQVGAKRKKRRRDLPSDRL